MALSPQSKNSCFLEPVISIPALLILGLTVWKTCTSAFLASKEQNIILSSPKVKIKKYGCGFISLTWDPQLTKEMEKFQAEYMFSYQYPNLKQWTDTEKTETNFARIGLKSYLGFNFKVYTQIKHQSGLLVAKSDWAEYNYQIPAVPITKLSCIVYNISNLKCTWKIKKESPEDLQYFFSYSYEKDHFECQQYLTNAKKKNIGCHMKNAHFNATDYKRICATVSTKDSEVPFNRSFLPFRIEKLTPPINISVSTGKRNARVQWSPPATIGLTSKSCFLYEVKLQQSNKEHPFRTSEIEEQEYIFPDYDERKRYSFQVRAKKNCLKGKYWGDWSEPVFIGEGDKAIFKPWMLVLVFLFSVIALGSFLGFLCKRYKILNLFFTPVPEPSHKITDWLTLEADRLQNNVLAQKEAAITEIVLATGDS